MKTLVKCFVFLLISTLLPYTSVSAEDKGDFSIEPISNNGQKWRIGYYEGGPYIEYQQTLVATIKGLMELGWIEQTEIPMQKGEQTDEFWNWLATEAKSEYLEFVKNAYYTADWDDDLRKKTVGEIITRLNETKDIELIIAMGTWAGQDIANDNHTIPTIAIAVSDAVGSGIVKSVEDSGYDHVHARIDPFRYERQVQIFHDIIGFQKLGVAYKNDLAGRTYAAIDKVEQVAQESGFELVSCYIKDTVAFEPEIEEESVKECFQELGEKTDAIYVTMHTAINSRSIPDLVNIANSLRIPTFSQAGSEEVKYGFLMSISLAEYKYVGRFHAETIAKIFNGAKPRDLEQVFEDPPKIAINLKTAEIIGYDPPVDVLGAADEIYQEIVKPE